MNRRRFVQGLVATAAGLLVPAEVAAEPERRVWAFPTNPLMHDRPLYMGPDPDRPERFVAMPYDEYERRTSHLRLQAYDYLVVDGEIMFVKEIRPEARQIVVARNVGGSQRPTRRNGGIHTIEVAG